MQNKRDTTRNTTPIRYTPVSVEETHQDSRRKSYKGHWKRASIKMKFRNMLIRLSKSQSDTNLTLPQGTQDLLNSRAYSISTIGIRSPSPFTILPYYTWYLLWLFFLCLIMMYITTYALFHTSFIGFSDHSNEANFEAFIDVTFFFDIIFSFNLAYFDEQNNLVIDKKQIALNYFASDFKFDLLLMLPTGILVKIIPEIQYFTIFMYRHLLRLAKWLMLKKRFCFFYFVKKIDHFLSMNRNLVQFVKILVIVFLSLHLVACCMFLASRSKGFSNETWAYRSNLLNHGPSYQYVTCLYWALTTLSSIGYGDNVPFTLEEKLIAISWMALGINLVSYTASLFTVIFNQILEKDTDIDENLLTAATFCHSRQIPLPLIKIVNMQIKNSNLKSTKIDALKLLENICIELRYEIALDIHNKAISKIPFLIEKTPFFLSIFTFYLQHTTVEANTNLWQRFVYADGIYFISTGRVKYTHEGSTFIVFHEGDYFGDIEVFYGIERKFKATALEDSSFFKISNEVLKEMKLMFPDEYYELKGNVKKRKNNLIKALIQIIWFKKIVDNINEHERAAFEFDLKKRLKKKLFFLKEKKLIKQKLEDLSGIILDTKYSIYKCKELLKCLL